MPKPAVFTYYNKHYQLLQDCSRSFFLTRNNKAGVSGARGLDIVYTPAQFLINTKRRKATASSAEQKVGLTLEKTDKFMAKNKSTANDFFVSLYCKSREILYLLLNKFPPVLFVYKSLISSIQT